MAHFWGLGRDVETGNLGPMYLWSLEPIIESQPDPTGPDQLFKGQATQHRHWVQGLLTTYAMGIKFVPAQGTTPPPPPACNNKLIVRPSTYSANQPTFAVPNAIDDNSATKWMSTVIPNPFITVGFDCCKACM